MPRWQTLHGIVNADLHAIDIAGARPEELQRIVALGGWRHRLDAPRPAAVAEHHAVVSEPLEHQFSDADAGAHHDGVADPSPHVGWRIVGITNGFLAVAASRRQGDQPRQASRTSADAAAPAPGILLPVW